LARAPPAVHVSVSVDGGCFAGGWWVGGGAFTAYRKDLGKHPAVQVPRTADKVHGKQSHLENIAHTWPKTNESC